MATYYDDNYGFYEIRDQDDIDFYHETQKASVWKKCHGCGKRVKIKPDYAYCNSCADARERGMDI
jgi:rRNA maturation endonuclease Nob1